MVAIITAILYYGWIQYTGAMAIAITPLKSKKEEEKNSTKRKLLWCEATLEQKMDYWGHSDIMCSREITPATPSDEPPILQLAKQARRATIQQDKEFGRKTRQKYQDVLSNRTIQKCS